MQTNFGRIGLLRDDRGGLYASLSAPGVAAETRLLKSGGEVDVVKTPAPPKPADQQDALTFGGVQAVLELDEDPAAAVPFIMKLRLDDEAKAWKGWPRSFGYQLEGYVHLPSQGVWRLLATVQGRVVTDGTTNHAGFLGDFASRVATLGSEKSCAAAGAAAGASALLAPAWYQQLNGTWTQFSSIEAASPVALDTPPTGGTSLRLMTGYSVASSASHTQLPGGHLPTVLQRFAVPMGDNSPTGDVAKGFRRFGPKVHRLAEWGQFYNHTRVFSCITPDLAAVMADPMQYNPEPVRQAHVDLCDPLLSQHFWWVPSGEAHLKEDIEWFYNEITVEKSQPNTFFMANGFAGGYFGIQEHTNGKRVALFSLWDAASKVEIVDWGEGVRVGRFGMEGTGANSKMVFPWQIGEPVRFLVNVRKEEPQKLGDGHNMLYSGYVHVPELGIWRLLSTFRVIPCGPSISTGGWLTGMNSFIEVFQSLPDRGTPECAVYGRERRARYGAPWFRKHGETDFRPFGSIVLTASCPKEGCPNKGLDFSVHAQPGAGEQFVLTVGADITNQGAPRGQPRQIKSDPVPPKVLTDGALPLGDNSPAGSWSAGEARPLRQGGDQTNLDHWGKSAAKNFLACPWYVSDCEQEGGNKK